MNKLIYIFLIILLSHSCSFNKNSKFWTSSKNLEEEKPDVKKVLKKDKILSQEFNKDLKINIKSKINTDISIKNIEDKKILGGIKLKVGNTLIDGSLSTKLEKLKENMVNK